MGNEINKKTVFSSLGWKFLERIFSQGINLLIQIVLARILLPEDFGSLAIIVAIINYVSIFVQSGLATAIVQKENLDELDVSTLLSSSLVIALVFYIGLFFAAPFISSYYGIPDLKLALRILALVLFLYALNSIQTALLSRKMNFKKLFVRSVIAVPISGAIGIIMAYCGCGIWALVVHNLANMLIVVIVMSFGLDMKLSFRFSLSRAKTLYAFSGKILLTSMITGGHDLIRTMVIGKRYSSNDLAYYDKAYTYSNYVTQIVNQSISSVLLPVFSRKQQDVSSLRSMARRSTTLSAFIMFPVLLGVAAVARPFVLTLLTSKWEKAIPFLMIFSILRIPGVISSVDKQVYYALGRSGINLAYEVVFCALNIIVLVITSKYGVLQIGIGATLVEIIGGIAIFFISSKVYGYSVRDRINDLWRPFINSFLMAIIVYQLNYLKISSWLLLLIQIVSGVVVYVILAIVTRDQSVKYIINMVKNRKQIGG